MAITANRSMRPITNAASARSRNDGPSTVPIGSPTAPARSHIPRNASTVATVHTIVWRRRTGMPSVDAAIGPLGARPYRDADVAESQPRSEGDESDGNRDHRDHVVAVEDRVPDLELHRERRVEPVGLEVLPERLREEEPGADQDLGEPDGGNREDQAGGAEESADDQRLDQDAEDDGGDEPRRERQEIIDTQRDDQQRPQRRRDLSEVALGEVDDPVGAVDQRDPERDERDAAAARARRRGSHRWGRGRARPEPRTRGRPGAGPTRADAGASRHPRGGCGRAATRQSCHACRAPRPPSARWRATLRFVCRTRTAPGRLIRCPVLPRRSRRPHEPPARRDLLAGSARRPRWSCAHDPSTPGCRSGAPDRHLP